MYRIKRRGPTCQIDWLFARRGASSGVAPQLNHTADSASRIGGPHSITSSARASSTAHRGNRASLWNWLELQFVGGRIDEPEFGVGLLRNRSAEKGEVFVGVRPVLPIAHSADRISDLIAEAILQR